MDRFTVGGRGHFNFVDGRLAGSRGLTEAPAVVAVDVPKGLDHPLDVIVIGGAFL